jgi:phosphoglycerol transferase MdoB-like AlkP superfamily enzyme
MDLNFSKVDQRLHDLLIPLPALAFGMLLLRMTELGQANQLGMTWYATLWAMLLNDGLVLLKGIPWWCLISLPLLAVKTEKHRLWGFALLSSLLLVLEAALIHYFEIAGVPLGFDLFGYSFQEMLTISSGADRPWPFDILCALIIGLMLVWGRVVMHRQKPIRVLPPRFSVVVLALGLISMPVLPTQINSGDLGQAYLQQRKLAFFAGDLLSHSIGNLLNGTNNFDKRPAYPFAHAETTPDTLGTLFNLKDKTPPHFVFIVVEGLGRSFSGPSSPLGSFTPFLDSLVEKSLYWENFLATQGRTFAVLPSVFGSLPFAPYGAKDLGHESMLSLLKSQGYALRYFSGSNLEFDNQGDYLKSEGVNNFVSEKDFSNAHTRATEWGYADADLFAKVADDLRQAQAQPTITIVQTMSMHTPFQFPGIELYRRKADERIAVLKVDANKQATYSKFRHIYASILYTDSAVKTFFEKLMQSPNWNNTIVVITGDHRLPEIPMGTRLERYHVPLLISSPMLKQAQSFKSVSSHFDIAPSIMAMLSKKYAYQTPTVVSWMGQGLDVQVPFRNVHKLPLKQTKTELSDFVSGDYYLAQDRLFRIGDGLQPEPVENQDILSELKDEFSQFRHSLTALEKADRLTPPDNLANKKLFSQVQRSLEPHGPIQHFKGVEVSEVKSVLKVDGYLEVTATFVNTGKQKKDVFVPLLVLTDTLGQELGEVSGKAIQLPAGQSQTVTLNLKLAQPSLISGRYFFSVVVSHPDTGKPIGKGQYHVAVQN